MTAEYEKDFVGWHLLKQLLNKKDREPFFYEREIWWVSIGCNVGFEEDGKKGKFSRPVLILRKFNKDIFWGIPLSSRSKEGKYYFNFVFRDDKRSTALLSQIRLWDSGRLVDKAGTMQEKTFVALKNKLKHIIDEVHQK